MYEKFGKRVFDIIFSSLGLIIFFPLMVLIAIAIKISSQGSIFFKQKRVGKNFKEFEIYKFRTMVENAEKNGPSVTVDGDERITKIGKFLRKTKLDELPQLFNVLKGDMSLVGPRPEVMKYVNEKKEDYKRILKIRPGITDYAAIEFRNEEEILKKYDDLEKAYIEIIQPKKIELYYKYLENMSFLEDIKIILKTLKVI
ncbi:sugar transferase [Caminibacter pacificus]|jgi:lipopolysaccharide/colanic/teichoic acid biosynthesis glycosyltransferase